MKKNVIKIAVSAVVLLLAGIPASVIYGADSNIIADGKNAVCISIENIDKNKLLPPSTPPKSTEPEQNGVNEEMKRSVIELINAERVERGLSMLILCEQASSVAQAKSDDMVTNDYFSHQSPLFGSHLDMIGRRGLGTSYNSDGERTFGISFSSAGINIARGQNTAEEAVRFWMNSENDRANILNQDFTEVGAGYAVDRNGQPYWTLIFLSW